MLSVARLSSNRGVLLDGRILKDELGLFVFLIFFGKFARLTLIALRVIPIQSSGEVEWEVALDNSKIFMNSTLTDVCRTRTTSCQ